METVNSHKKFSNIDTQILTINRQICNNIKKTKTCERGFIAQNILAQLRNFVEHIMLKFYASNCNMEDIDDTYENICEAIKYVKTRGQLKILYKFHVYLQIAASHYTLDEENSERLMLKYNTSLFKIRALLYEKYKLNVLSNLEEFPIHQDSEIQEYYEKIAIKVKQHSLNSIKNNLDKYYIQKIKPFFALGELFYEVTFAPANDYASKFDRVIAFTRIEITDYYAVELLTEPDKITVLNRPMQILIITAWKVSIRNCEYKNFSKIISGTGKSTSKIERNNISRLLTATGFNLADLLEFTDTEFHQVWQQITKNCSNVVFFNDLKICREIVKKNQAGANLLRYLLYHMNNRVIKKQLNNQPNNLLSNLYMQNGSIPFDNMPYINSTIGHNPQLRDLFDCIPMKGHEHELFARFVRNNAEISGELFTSIKDVQEFGNIYDLAKKYNRKLWCGHREQSKLVIKDGQVFINHYKEDTCAIIKTLQLLTNSGIQNYSSAVEEWLDSPNHGVDSEEKKKALIRMFENSRVSLIYGSAGTGKSTLINHVAHFLARYKKMFLAQTNPAVDNLKRRVTASNSNFSTIAKFIRDDYYTNCEYDLLVVDECSTVSNKDMCLLLKKAKFKLLLLVGDIYQISSIRFGNWFSVVRSFISPVSVFELSDPYRTNNKCLLTLWNRVRNMDDRILETIARKGYSCTLDSSIFTSAETDEIILCLNYDGLYGINNINRFLQESNPKQSFQWGIQQFKIGDPILFNESNRFSPVIYNNMKGRIIDIQILNPGEITAKILFNIEVNKVITGIEAMGQDFILLPNSENGNSVIQFAVNKTKTIDEDEDENNSKAIVPFQVAYAVSIHKAQGLEYKSVKIVITHEVDELITHNIFYTAITRACEKLKIYWSPEVEHKVLTSMKPINIQKDVNLLKQYIEIKETK